ncbi:hypothetical protein F2Q69_00024060 [Brassica cretica]|uniref:Uncharacterized protein n=1 Tax=Brassica cretica TaxID=69181 RepID=A0A8S9Q8C5_BRACR|nr:hypothetical protein F2Q69_00024060 [Brassica cretica]
MFRQASRLVSRSITAKSATNRAFSTEVPSTIDSSFVEAWKKVAPNMDPPQTPSSFMKPRPSTASSIPTKLTVNFVLPYASELSGKENIHSVLKVLIVPPDLLSDASIAYIRERRHGHHSRDNRTNGCFAWTRSNNR